jgi:hypothetical protein
VTTRKELIKNNIIHSLKYFQEFHEEDYAITENGILEITQNILKHLVNKSRMLFLWIM